MRAGVLFIQSATLPPLGADIWVHSLIMRHLDRGRFHVHAACATPTFEALSLIPDLELVPVNFGPEMSHRTVLGRAQGAVETLPAVYNLARVASYIRKHKIRVLHTSDRPRDALACVALGKLTGAKSVIQVHVEYGAWMSPILRWSLLQADALIGVSSFVARSLSDAGHRKETMHVVHNAIDLPKWDPDLDGGPVRAELGIPPGATVLVCIARIFKHKGHEGLIRALASLRQMNGGIAPHDPRLLIVGQDYPVGTSYSKELKALARELGVEKQVVFTGQRRDVDRVLAASDIYAMPSSREPFGLVFAEAMAMRRPVVALHTGGVLEVVEHGKSGLLSGEDDQVALTENLRKLIVDRALRTAMGAAGRARVEQLFAPERQARDVEAVYATLEQKRR
jgi:glycosyltransferase involved in cell wall biosynthesis